MDDRSPQPAPAHPSAPAPWPTAALALVARLLRRASFPGLRERLRLMSLTATGRVRFGKGTHVDPTATIDLSWGGSLEVGEWCCLCHGSYVAPYGGRITMGERVYFGPYCVVYGHGNLTIGRHTMIAAHTVIIPANHAFDRVDVPICDQPVTGLGVEIGEDCWIGCGVRILDGVRIGRGCVVGAGAVVSKSLPDYSVAVGVPAKVVKTRRPGEPSGEALTSVGAGSAADVTKCNIMQHSAGYSDGPSAQSVQETGALARK